VTTKPYFIENAHETEKKHLKKMSNIKNADFFVGSLLFVLYLLFVYLSFNELGKFFVVSFIYFPVHVLYVFAFDCFKKRNFNNWELIDSQDYGILISNLFEYKEDPTIYSVISKISDSGRRPTVLESKLLNDYVAKIVSKKEALIKREKDAHIEDANKIKLSNFLAR
jgi:hypothetical protein